MIIITDDLHIIEIKPYYQILDKPTIIMVEDKDGIYPKPKELNNVAK